MAKKFWLKINLADGSAEKSHMLHVARAMIVLSFCISKICIHIKHIIELLNPIMELLIVLV